MGKDELIEVMTKAIATSAGKRFLWPHFNSHTRAALDELAKHIPNFDMLLDGTGVVVPIEPSEDMLMSCEYPNGLDEREYYTHRKNYKAIIQAAQKED